MGEGEKVEKVFCRICGCSMGLWHWDGVTFASFVPLMVGDLCRSCSEKDEKKGG